MPRFEILDWDNAKTGLAFDDWFDAVCAAEARVKEKGHLVKMIDHEDNEARDCGPTGWERHWHSLSEDGE